MSRNASTAEPHSVTSVSNSEGVAQYNPDAGYSFVLGTPGQNNPVPMMDTGMPFLTLAGSLTPRRVVMTVPHTEPQPGSVWQFFQLLKSSGILTESFLEQHKNIDLNDLAALLHYLRVAILNGEPTPQKLQFHLDLINAMAPSDYSNWRILLQELRYKSKLSNAVLDFSEKKEFDELLHRKLLKRLGLERLADPAPRLHKEGYFRSMLKFLEQWQALVSDDPNVVLLWQLINRYGSILTYFARDLVPRRPILRMVELGFNVDHLVFGQDEICSVGPSAMHEPEKWADKLKEVVKDVVGSRVEEPEIELGLDRHKFFHQIKDDYDSLVKEEDAAAALRIISQLQPLLEQRRDTLLRGGDIVSREKVSRYLYELQFIHKLLTGELERLPTPYRLRAMRSTKLVPELLFDNTRFACCLFKPSGLFHGEICLLLLDPTTPMIEFWLDPYTEFLGLATMYAGLNGQGRRVNFLDTMEYDDRLLDMNGYNGTMRFMLQAIVLDAYRANAEKLVVFAAPYGKPVGFANYVRLTAAKSKAITYHDSYFFESADPEDTSLGISLHNKHHYTAAFGYDAPMKGNIDFGFNLLGVGTVSKLLTGGQGVYEIDVETFIHENGMWQGIAAERIKRDLSLQSADESALLAMDDIKADILVHRLPDNHEAEIHRREERAIRGGIQELAKVLKKPTLELTDQASDGLIQELLDLEKLSFNRDLRYEASHFTERLRQRRAELMLVLDEGKLIGFALSYVSPVVTEQGLYLDDLVLAPELQSKGIGSILLDVFIELASVRGYQGIYVLAELGAASIPLIKFYQRAGFQFLGPYSDIGNLLYKPLWIAGPENGKALNIILQKLRDQLRKPLTNPKVAFYSNLDPEIIQVLQSLEVVFPEHLRYSEAQFREHMSYPDSYIVVIYEQNEPVAYNITCHHPNLPEHAILLDSMSVKPEFQKRGIGMMLLNTQFAIPTLTHYTRAASYCQGKNQDGVDLLNFYTRLGYAVVGGNARDNSYRLMADISIASTDPAKVGEVIASAPGQSPSPTAKTEGTISSETRGPSSKEKSGGATEATSEDEAAEAETVTDLAFVGESIAEKLSEVGVNNTRDLFAKANTREGRTALAKASGVKANSLFAAVNLAELLRAGVPAGYLPLLKRHGVNSLKELRSISASKLRSILPDDVPDQTLSNWQKRAKSLKSIAKS